MDTAPGNQNNGIGFRCASDPVAIFSSHQSNSGRAATGGNEISAGPIVDALSYQVINVGGTEDYELSAYVYDATTGNEGGTVNSSVAQLYYHGEAIATTYTDTGDGWWRLSATITGADEDRRYGVAVKTEKTVRIDDFTLAQAGEYTIYTTTAYTNNQVVTYDTFCAGEFVDGECTNDGITTSGGMQVRFQLCDDDGVACESDNAWQYYDGEDWTTASNITTHTNTVDELTSEVMQDFDPSNQVLSIKLIFEFEGVYVPTVEHISIGLTTDTVPPPVNASDIQMNVHAGGRVIAHEEWANNPAPFFGWTTGADDEEGSGLRGYCLYLGTDSSGDPATSKGLLGSSPVSTTGTTCGFIVASSHIDFSTLSYRGDTWLTSSNDLYYLNIKAVDNAGLTYTGSSAQFAFYYDDTAPDNVSYINPASGSFSNVGDMNFSWPTAGGAASSDAHAGVLGWQYSVNSQSDWKGEITHPDFELSYIPFDFEQPYYLDNTQDGADIIIGDNVVYFRTVDGAGNVSLPSTYRTGVLSYGGAAPTFSGDAVVTVTPHTSDTNYFALSWPAATPADGESLNRYYYMVNTTPPASLDTLTGNSATYIPVTGTSVPAGMRAGVQKGTNVVRVVAVDTNGNYSPSNVISGTFVLDSDNPDPARDLAVSDASIKAVNLWRASLAWDQPVYTGTGALTYVVQRSLNGTAWTTVTTTTGNAFVDTVPESRQYYWRVGTQDTSDVSIANPSFTNAVTLTPRGSFTEPADLTSGPVATNVSNRRAQITWTTNRTSDSRVAFGTTPGEYFTEEPANSSQVTEHVINLNNLSPGTTYYYTARWTDEDGNTGHSSEHGFTTRPAPTVTHPQVRQVGLTNAILQYTTRGASSVKIYYGTTTNFGGIVEVATAASEATYTTELSGLEDGRLYYYKINTVDEEGFEYDGSTLAFETLPRPRISNVRLQQVANTAQTTLMVSWDTNTEVSAIVTVYPSDNPAQTRDFVDVDLQSGSRQMVISGLLPQENYTLVVRGRDRIGNEAVSDLQFFTTATDTRPPQISNLKVIGGTIPPVGFAAGDVRAQLVVTWDTDEPATSQIEYGEGTGSAYAQRTQEDGNLTMNHSVIISGLTPSNIYHLRAISKDVAGNEQRSIDVVTVAPRATQSALDLVVGNLSDFFSFFGDLFR